MQGHYPLYAGSASQQLTAGVAPQLGARVGKLQQRYFEDGEFHCQVEDSVRGQNIIHHNLSVSTLFGSDKIQPV